MAVGVVTFSVLVCQVVSCKTHVSAYANARFASLRMLDSSRICTGIAQPRTSDRIRPSGPSDKLEPGHVRNRGWCMGNALPN